MLPSSKQVIVIAQVDITAAATQTANIDTLGYDFMSLDVIMGTSDDATNNPSTFKLAESDDTVVTNFGDITAFVGDGTGGWTIPAADTANTTGFKFNADLRGRKRYLKLTIAAVGTNQLTTAIANLHRGDEAPVNTTDAGVVALVEG